MEPLGVRRSPIRGLQIRTTRGCAAKRTRDEWGRTSRLAGTSSERPSVQSSGLRRRSAQSPSRSPQHRRNVQSRASPPRARALHQYPSKKKTPLSEAQPNNERKALKTVGCDASLRQREPLAPQHRPQRRRRLEVGDSVWTILPPAWWPTYLWLLEFSASP